MPRNKAASRGTDFGAHQGQETHRGVVLHGGMLGNGELLVVALPGGWWRCLRGSRQGRTWLKMTG
jgi:hypothetical protein